MRDFFSFLTAHIWPTIWLVFGGFIAIGSSIIGGYRIITLPLPWPIFLAMGLFVFFASIILLLFANYRSHSTLTGDLKTKESSSKTLLRSNDEPFGGGQLLGVPIDSPLQQTVFTPEAPPSKADTDEQKAAKQKLGLAARDVFYDADYALMPVICFARDSLQIRYGNGSKTAQAVGKGVDIMQGPPHHFKDQNIPLVHELRQPDKLRDINLHHAQSAYYYNFAFYADKIRLLDDLLRKAGPYHPIRLEELKTKFNAWWTLHEKLLKKNKELGEDIELYTIADIPKTIPPLPELPDLDDLVDKPVVRDTPLGRALGFLVSRNWNSGDFFNTISDGKAKDGRGEMALNELHQSMRDGELISWGRKSERHAWEQILPEHWSEYTFDFYSTWHDTMHQGAKDESIEFEASENRSQYQDLMVSKSQMEKLWPNGLSP